MPEVAERVRELKDRLEIEVEKEDRDKAKLAFAKISIEGQKPARFFCSLEKQKRKTTLLELVLIQNEQDKEKECFEQSTIEEEVLKFYKNLYTRTPTYATKTDIINYIGKSKIKKLTDKEVARLETRIDQCEVNKCLQNGRNNVAPGASGSTGSFYKVFWNLLSSLVTRAITNLSIKGTCLPCRDQEL